MGSKVIILRFRDARGKRKSLFTFGLFLPIGFSSSWVSRWLLLIGGIVAVRWHLCRVLWCSLVMSWEREAFGSCCGKDWARRSTDSAGRSREWASTFIERMEAIVVACIQAVLVVAACGISRIMCIVRVVLSWRYWLAVLLLLNGKWFRRVSLRKEKSWFRFVLIRMVMMDVWRVQEVQELSWTYRWRCRGYCSRYRATKTHFQKLFSKKEARRQGDRKSWTSRWGSERWNYFDKRSLFLWIPSFDSIDVLCWLCWLFAVLLFGSKCGSDNFLTKKLRITLLLKII